ncbi:MAG: phosphate acyltransferase, partial [Phascolarctobacterium sp.]|nr:phosphate acyltransferase [Phascolarctobacterium sp.]
MKIALDIMGTDYGPKELVLGAINAVKKFDCEVVLVGDEVVAKDLLRQYKELDNQRIKIQYASQVINMDEHPAIAVKSKKDASIVVASKMLRAGECDALVSAGSTGAASVAAVLCVGRIKGVERPAIATAIPSLTGATVVL